jgi:Tol biopolymer transport system component
VWQIVLVPVDGGPVRTLKTLDWRIPMRMNFSPDGRFVVYDFPTTPESSLDRDLFVLDLANGKEQRLVQHPSNDYVLGWGPDTSHVLFASNRSGTLGAWLQEVENGRPKGVPVLVKGDLWNAGTGQFTADGSFLYTVRTGTRQVQLVTIDSATGRAIGPVTSVTPAPLAEVGDPQWSPDGRSVSYATRRPGTTPLITIRSLESGAVREIPVPHELVYSYHHWSSDGKSLVLSGRPKGRAGVYRMDLRTSATDLLFKLDAEAAIAGGRAFAITPDDRAVVYSKVFTKNGETAADLVVHDLKSHEERVLHRPPALMGIALAVSPDGRFVAFTDGFRQDAKLMVVPIAGGEARRIGGAFIPRMHSPLAWSADGRSVLAITLEDSTGKNAVWRVPVAGGAIDSTGVVAASLGALQLDASGRRLLFVAGNAASELWQMQGIASVVKTAQGSR